MKGSGRPLTRPEVSAFPLDDELVLYDGRTGEAHLLNRTGAYVWHLCDGGHTVTQLAREVAAAYCIPRRQALTDIGDLIAALDNADLVVVS